MTNTTRTQKKIERLRALIDHPRTADNERSAAERMLRRVLDRAKADNVQLGGAGCVDTRVYGEKYDQVRDLGLAEIAKLMRQDVKLARKLGQQEAEPSALALMDALGTMPAPIKISIKSRYYSGGGSIDIRVKGIPYDWGFVKEEDMRGHMRTVPSPALAAVLADLKVIHWAYNYDGGDPYAEYAHRNYLGAVDYERPYDRM
ncbi:hypothetical protein ACFRQM_09395 [Streptomyces sp. NPDC056831]|uniref:hypothetical protein n=1 Tax=Streptomyces sp. NPDC056831 TaxID=3345954 RepID=UPI00367EA214